MTQSNLREQYMKLIGDFLQKHDEEILRTATNELTIPCVDNEGEDRYLTLVFKIPKGSRDGEPYDGYEMAAEYNRRCKEKAEKAKKKKKEDGAK